MAKRSGQDEPDMQVKRFRRKTKMGRRDDIPEEIWSYLAKLLAPSRGALLNLAMVCRTTRDMILRDNKLWVQILREDQTEFFRKLTVSKLCGVPVVRGVIMSPYPHSLGNLRFNSTPVFHILRAKNNLNDWPRLTRSDEVEPFDEGEMMLLADHSRRRVRLEHGTHCALCGCRFYHIAIWGLGFRACSGCLKDNLVSNVVLLKDFGVNFEKRIGEIAGRVFYFMPRSKQVSVLSHFTQSPLDFQCNHKRHLVFFWKPHLDKVFGLEELRREHIVRREAAPRIAAAARALCVRLACARPPRGSIPFDQDHTFFTYKMLTMVENLVIFKLSVHNTRAFTDDDVQGRTLLQRALVMYKEQVRMVLPANKKAPRALENLRFLEATRGSNLVKDIVPFPCTMRTASQITFKRYIDSPVGM